MICIEGETTDELLSTTDYTCCNDYRDNIIAFCHETRNMSRAKQISPQNIAGRRIRALREGRGWSQEKLGVAIGIDESSARARISRYELGVHEPPLPTVRLIANALNAPVAHLYCDDDSTAELLLKLHSLDGKVREVQIRKFLAALA
ncbi:helix-turn-helix domain-containing protein [Propionivibrio sp.]|uniref:helix-turn-helix domain-containing protein n=1 Tax=Propionivibrio sp. TaxID=2212460 RepID=UPI0039E65637